MSVCVSVWVFVCHLSILIYCWWYLLQLFRRCWCKCSLSFYLCHKWFVEEGPVATDRRTDRQTDGRTHRQTDRQWDGLTVGRIDRRLDSDTKCIWQMTFHRLPDTFSGLKHFRDWAEQSVFKWISCCCCYFIFLQGGKAKEKGPHFSFLLSFFLFTLRWHPKKISISTSICLLSLVIEFNLQ